MTSTLHYSIYGNPPLSLSLNTHNLHRLRRLARGRQIVCLPSFNETCLTPFLPFLSTSFCLFLMSYLNVHEQEPEGVRQKCVCVTSSGRGIIVMVAEVLVVAVAIADDFGHFSVSFVYGGNRMFCSHLYNNSNDNHVDLKTTTFRHPLMPFIARPFIHWRKCSPVFPSCFLSCSNIYPHPPAI